MSVWPLPCVTFRELSSIEEKRPVALLATNDVWAAVNSHLTLPVAIQAEPESYSRDLFEYLADHLPAQVEAIYVVGQGAPVQAGKIVASRNQKPLIVVPTALDSDQALTPAALVEAANGDKKRLTWAETGPATEVIVDWDVIQAAPGAIRGAGIVDVVSIVTGLLDWRYAAQKGKNPPEQRFTPWVASVAAGLASQAIKSAAAIGQGDQEALRLLLDLLMMTVQLSNQLGHLRVQAGSEHYLAQILAEAVSPNLAYADLVGPCLLLVSALHGQDPTALREALQGAGVRLDQLHAADVQMVINTFPAAAVAYGLPYSVLNDLDPQSELVAQAFKAAGLVAPG